MTNKVLADDKVLWLGGGLAGGDFIRASDAKPESWWLREGLRIANQRLEEIEVRFPDGRRSVIWPKWHWKSVRRKVLTRAVRMAKEGSQPTGPCDVRVFVDGRYWFRVSPDGTVKNERPLSPPFEALLRTRKQTAHGTWVMDCPDCGRPGELLRLESIPHPGQYAWHCVWCKTGYLDDEACALAGREAPQGDGKDGPRPGEYVGPAVKGFLEG